MVPHAFNSSTQQAKARRWRAGGQPRLHSNTPSPNKIKQIVNCLAWWSEDESSGWESSIRSSRSHSPTQVVPKKLLVVPPGSGEFTADGRLACLWFRILISELVPLETSVIFLWAPSNSTPQGHKTQSKLLFLCNMNNHWVHAKSHGVHFQVFFLFQIGILEYDNGFPLVFLFGLFCFVLCKVPHYRQLIFLAIWCCLGMY